MVARSGVLANVALADEAPQAPMTSSSHVAPRPHVCFVAMHIYPTLVGSTNVERAGGAEVQQTILARALVADGYRVSVLTADCGQPQLVECDGIRIHRIREPGSRGVKGLRLLHPHITDVVAGLREIDPDLVYFRVAGFRAAAAAWYARRVGRPFVYACASDLELLGKEPQGGRDAFLFHLGLRAADGVLVQNVRQQQLLQGRFGKQGVVIPNCFVDADAGSGTNEGHVLWVGSVKPLKNPEAFIELARRLPHKKFRMVGGPNLDDANGRAYFEGIKQLAASVQNVEFVGFVPFRDVGYHFDDACVVVNTSPTEGFPNTFLQAWIRGVPTVSFVRPEVVPGQTGTLPCADTDEMATRLAELTGNPLAWARASQSCRDHFESVHGVKAALRGYRDFFDQVLAQRPRKR